MKNSSDNFGYNECVSRGVCSVIPSIAALQEVMLVILRQSSYYVLKLESAKVDVSGIKSSIINIIANYMFLPELNEVSLISVVAYSYGNLLSLKERYKAHCKDFNIKYKDVNSLLQISSAMSMSQIITLGEKIFRDKYKKATTLRKNYSELLFILIRSFASSVVKLNSFGITSSKYSDMIVQSLDLLNRHQVSAEKFSSWVDTLVQADNEIKNIIFEKQQEFFGSLKLKEVSHSTTKGKAILVSGSSLSDLKKIIDIAEGYDVDIYTHGELIAAHSYENFAKSQLLKGHYGYCYNNCLLDFATFPGPILLTKGYGINTEYIYRGRLFSTSPINSPSVVRIRENEFMSVIESAQNSKGFAKGQLRNSEFVGIDYENIDSLIENILSQFNENKFTQLLVLDFNPSLCTEDDNWLKSVPDNVFIISFMKLSFKRKNLLSINFGNNRDLILFFVKYFSKKLYENVDKISVLLSLNEVFSISALLYLKGFANVELYITDSSKRILNPLIEKFFDEYYNIRKLDNVESIIKNIKF